MNETTNDTVEAENTGASNTINEIAVSTLDTADPPIVNEGVAEPMELDQQINNSMSAPPSGTRYHHMTISLHHLYTQNYSACLRELLSSSRY